MFEKILIPTDLSEMSEKLVACADSIRDAKEVVLLHIVHSRNDLLRERKDTVRQQALIRNPGITVRSNIDDDNGDNIPAAILKMAKAEKPSLIIMGARKGLLSKILPCHGTTEFLTRRRTLVFILRFSGLGLFAARQ
jgi:nucleotide-binding universal stress UspA family protein